MHETLYSCSFTMKLSVEMRYMWYIYSKGWETMVAFNRESTQNYSKTFWRLLYFQCRALFFDKNRQKFILQDENKIEWFCWLASLANNTSTTVLHASSTPLHWITTNRSSKGLCAVFSSFPVECNRSFPCFTIDIPSFSLMMAQSERSPHLETSGSSKLRSNF